MLMSYFLIFKFLERSQETKILGLNNNMIFFALSLHVLFYNNNILRSHISTQYHITIDML